jgi:replicative DNA helicase
MIEIQQRSEEVVLNSIFTDPKTIHDIMNRVSSDMFKDFTNKLLFEASVELYVEQTPIDIVSMSKHILQFPKKYDKSILLEISKISSKVGYVPSYEVEDCIGHLISESIRFEHEELGTRLIQMSKADAYDPTNVLRFLQAHLSENKFNSLIKKKELTNEDLMNELDAQMQKAREHDGISGLRTGYNDYDTITSGMQPTNLIIIAARPAMGKTQWALGVMNNLSIKDDKKGVFFSCEMDEVQVSKRLICIRGNIRGYSVKYGNLSKGEWYSYARTREEFINSSAKILSRSWHIDDIVAKSHELMNSDGLDYIIVDYIQIVNAKGNGNKNSEVEEVTRKLKELANELNIPVIALSQLSRAVEQRPDKKPMLSDLRDSGSIEQDADIVMFLYRPSYYMSPEEREGNPIEKEGYGIIAKHRDGELKDIKMRFEFDIPAWMNYNDHDPVPRIPGEEIEMEFEETPSAMQPNNDFDKGDDDLPF